MTNFATLIGTEKQVAWVTEIRQQFITLVETKAASLEKEAARREAKRGVDRFVTEMRQQATDLREFSRLAVENVAEVNPWINSKDCFNVASILARVVHLKTQFDLGKIQGLI